MKTIKYNNSYFLLFICLSLLFVKKVTALQNHKPFSIKPFQNNVFIKEEGQFTRNSKYMNIPFSEAVYFGIEKSDFNAYFTASGIIFQFPERKRIRVVETEEEEEREREKEINERRVGKFWKREKNGVETIWHTVSMKWVNSNSSVQIIPKEKVPGYYNYDGYTVEDTTHFEFVNAYKSIIYKNLYPGIDAEFEIPEEGGIKYKLVVHEHVELPEIAVIWEGLDKVKLDDEGNLHLKSFFKAFGTKSKWQLVDRAPFAYKLNNKQNIPVKYAINGNKVSFDLKYGKPITEEELIIDPWITNTSFPDLNKAYDIQEDSLGNVFIIGNSSNWQVQKYNSNGSLLWTYVTYAVLMGDIAVDNPGNVYICGGYSAGKRQKLDTAGVQQWVQSGLVEEWRLAFNYSKTILTIGGYFLNPGSNNLAQLDLANGAISNQIVYGAETRGIATDCNGDMYSLHVTFGYSGDAATNTLRKTLSNFTPGGSMQSGFLIAEAMPASTCYGTNPAYSGSSTYQVLNAIAVNGPFVYLFDGAKLEKVDKSALVIVNTVPVPNGVVTMCGGVATDLCGNIYVGSTTGIEKFDSALTHVQSIVAPGPVYDLILSKDGDLLACGLGFVGRFTINCSAPTPLTATLTSTPESCKGGTATVSASGGTPPYSYLWLPGGQTGSTADSLTAGTYTCTVTDPFCHTFTDTITVNHILPINLLIGETDTSSLSNSIIKETCMGRSDGSAVVHANGGAPPYNYLWNTNPQQTTPMAGGLVAGTYLCTVSDTNQCKDTLSVLITRNPNPTANFGSSAECNGYSSIFTDSSSTTAGSIVSWQWSFGDNSAINTSSNPSYLYGSGGTYQTTLIVANSFTCSDTISKPVQVYFNPVASFTFNDVCLHDTIHFTNSSSIDNSTSIAYYRWSFGDGSPLSSAQNPSHYYANPGTYTVLLYVKSIDSCFDTVTAHINVFDPPTSNFSFSNICLYDSAHFINSSLQPFMGTVASWQWNFGDGTPTNSTLWNAIHHYNTPGVYGVELVTRSSNLACADTLIDSIEIYSLPVAGCYATEVCLGEPTPYIDTTVISSGTIVTWNWNFGDSLFSAQENPNHTYNSFGTYTATLITISNHGCMDTTTTSTIVHPLPIVEFSSSNVCLGTPSTFLNQSQIPPNTSNDNLSLYHWNLGDSSSVADSVNITHLYNAIGTYTVSLTTISSFGCADSISKTTIVNPNPVVNFTASDTIGCEPLCLSFTDSSSLASGNNVQWLWGLGNGNNINSSNTFDYCYNYNSSLAPGPFEPEVLSVTLTVTSDSGCSSSFVRNNYIIIYANPVAEFSVSPAITTITEPLVEINNLSMGADYWYWTLGDGDTSSLQTVSSHSYSDTGKYTITLITSSQYGCLDTTYKTIVIEPDFMFYVPNAFTPNDDGVNDTFIGKGYFIKEFEMYIFDRWGELIYDTNDINKPWNGKANHGADFAKTDVYVYLIKVSDFKDQKHTYRGTVSLVR